MGDSIAQWLSNIATDSSSLVNGSSDSVTAPILRSLANSTSDPYSLAASISGATVTTLEEYPDSSIAQAVVSLHDGVGEVVDKISDSLPSFPSGGSLLTGGVIIVIVLILLLLLLGKVEAL